MPNSPKTALIIGATSSLAQALCRQLAEHGMHLILVGRDERELEIRAGDIMTRYSVNCRILHMDLMEKHFSASKLIEQAKAFNLLVMVAGDMGSSEQDDLGNLSHVAMMNYVIPSQIMSVAAESMSEQDGGSIIAISSVAGDRGRASNYEYGSAKAALTAFASGLRNRYAQKGVHVMTVKLGFTDTPMTWGMDSPLIAPRKAVARAILEALKKKKNCVYIPWFWHIIMGIICAIPESIFKKLKL